MFGVVAQRWGTERHYLGRAGKDGWELDSDRLPALLRQDATTPTIVLGTAFSYVHLLDWLDQSGEQWKLPAGSCALETGGYKGRSRVLEKTELHFLIQRRLGILPDRIVCEYGMSELSSQAYDHTLGEASHTNHSAPAREPMESARRIFHFPPWVRTRIISPETLQEVREGEAGLLQVFDLANVQSVLAVQTEDLAVKQGPGFTLIGRDRASEPRGCSLNTIA